jgi:hypothetical protein
MRDAGRVQLLFGPYAAPRLRRGQRATCLFRDCDVVITGRTAARLDWPLCRPLGKPIGRPTILVDEELARAVRYESALALRHWWGVGESLVWKWRQALGVPPLNEGSARLRTALNGELNEEKRGVPLPAEQVERRRRTARQLDLGRHLWKGYHGPRWTAKELALLGRASDEEVARRTGRTTNAVRQRRELLGIPRAF